MTGRTQASWRSTLWLLAALGLVTLWIWRSMAPALDPIVIQDDARQHAFWMQRFVDPTLFQGDLFAEYFASQAPPGFVLLFRGLLLFADPLTATKLLPPMLGLVAATFTFLLVRRLSGSSVAAFLTTILQSWYVWQYDDLPTGSPRAFLLPLTVVLLCGLARDWRWWGVALVVALEAVVYPSAAALGVALVGARLLRLDRWPPRFDLSRSAWVTFAACTVVCVVLLIPTVLGDTRFGPTVTADAARQMPEFGPNGRNAFFLPDAYAYWVTSYRSGFDLRVADARMPSIPIFYELLALACAIVPAAWLGVRRREVLPLGPTLALVVQVLAASVGLFVLAHLLLFRLYLPARFVAWTVPLALAIWAGVGIAALLERATARLGLRCARIAVGGLAALLAVALVLYPARFDGNFVRDRTPELTAYLRTLPPDTLVLAAPTDGDSVPAFAGRPVLVSREYALAYHLGFYRQVEQRVRAAIDIYYSPTVAEAADLSARNGVSVILVNRTAFEPATAADAWSGAFEPYTSLVLERLQRGRRFGLLDAARLCAAMTEGDVTVVHVACLRARS